MYFDVSFTLNKAGGGVVLISPKGDRLLYVIQLHFCATNNVVEYEALVNGLRITTKLGVQRLYICGDSNLIANQVLGESNCRDSCMATYRQEVRMLEENIDSFEFHHVLWWDIKATDILAWLRPSRKPPPPGVFMQDLCKPSIWLEEDISVPARGISSVEDSLVLVPGTQPGKGSLTLTSEANSIALAGPVGLNWEPEGEIAAVVGPPDPDKDWRKQIFEYLQLGTIPDDNWNPTPHAPSQRIPNSQQLAISPQHL
jgi:ribonuclease HI